MESRPSFVTHDSVVVFGRIVNSAELEPTLYRYSEYRTYAAISRKGPAGAHIRYSRPIKKVPRGTLRYLYRLLRSY